MKKTFTIAAREYLAAVKTRAFVISVVLLPVMMFGTLALQHATEKLSDVNDRRYAILDRTSGEAVFGPLDAAVKRRNEHVKDVPRWLLEEVKPTTDTIDAQRLKLSDDIRSGRLAGYVEIGPDVLMPTTTPADKSHGLLYQTNTPTYTDFRDFVSTTCNQTIRDQRLKAAGFDAKALAPLIASVRVTDGGLAHRDERGAIVYDQAQSGVTALMVPFGLIMMMFMVVIVGAIPMMQGVIEEKQQRIAEVLLASVQPFELMAGKLLGMAAVSLTLIGLYGIGAGWGSGRFHLMSYAGAYLTPSVMICFAIMQVLAVLMFGSMYIAVGACCTDMKEAQALLLPLNLLIMLPLMLAFSVIQHPNGALARGLSFFPLAAPMLTVARMSVPPGVAWWEVVGPVIIVAATTVVFVWAAGRIFRVGIMAGSAGSFWTMVKWAIRG